MKRDIVRSELALADFENLFEYIAADSLKNARLVADRIEHNVDLLSTTPFGRAGRVTGTYEASVSKVPFIVVYELPNDHTLAIRRIVHTSRNWPAGRWPEDDQV